MLLRPVVSLVVALVVASSSLAQAQTPQQQPLVQPGNFAYLGKFTLPKVDPTGGQLTWGGAPIGMGADGVSMYYGCMYGGSAARVSIPTLGGVGTVLDPCRGPVDLYKVSTDSNPKVLGGVMPWNGRIVVTGYGYYDASHTSRASHFAGASIGAAVGPVTVGTTKSGLVAGSMTPIPTEWRALFGGPALTGQCCIPIITRSSFGPSASVFNPDDVGVVSPVPSQLLVGYPDGHTTLGQFDSPGPYFNGATKMGGLAFPAGTRTVLFIGRHGSTYCYGVGTTDPTLDHKPTPSGGTWCYDPVDLNQGNHGYPYRHMVWAYDANDLLAVHQGTKQPWDLRPYATWNLTDMNSNGAAVIQSATFDPATRRLYVAADSNGNAPTVHVYEITNAVIQPPSGGTEICGDGIDNDNDGQIDEGCGNNQPEICGDLIDNDGDGQIDEGCPGEGKVEICGDGIDNDGDGQVDEDCETEGSVPGVPQRLYGAVRRSTVSFKWYPPLTGGVVVDYVLEAGLSPGTTFFAGSVGASTYITVPDVGTGRYYVRVRARNGNGQSAPSNEVVVSVGCRWRPSRLSGLSATTNQGLVSLKWTDPDGCSGTKYNVTVAATTGGMQTLQTEENNATTLLPKGNYLARVVAEAETGTSDPADLQFAVNGSACVAPSFRTKLRLVVAGRRIGLFWSPLDPETAKADDAVAPVSYNIEAGTAAGATDIGALPMDRATQLITEVPPGTYYARIRPTNACGGGFASNEVKIVVR